MSCSLDSLLFLILLFTNPNKDIVYLLSVSVSCLSVRPNPCLCLLQVKELQSKLAVLVREKTDALSLKAQIEEQYHILTAQLRAKVRTAEYLSLSCVMYHK